MVVQTIFVSAERVQAEIQQAVHGRIIERLHPAIGVVNDEQFLSAQHL